MANPAELGVGRANHLQRLANETYDILVIGGGVAGTCAAWDAAMRGHTVALIERSDFASGTSAHSLKVLHGGIRYLQHMDLARLAESCAERAAFLRIAPHLTRPLPFAVPTRGLGMQSKWPLQLAFMALRMLTAGRNRDIRPASQHIPNGTTLSRAAFRSKFPSFDDPAWTGAGIFYDGQIWNPPRLVWAIARSAQAHGAATANYCGAETLIVENGRVVGAKVCDETTGERFDVRARVVINAGGPFAPGIFHRSDSPTASVPFSRDMAFVVPAKIALPMAVAVQTKFKDPDAWISRGNRHLFVVPWRPGLALIGVNSRIAPESPNQLVVTEQEIAAFVEEINAAHPALDIARDDVLVVNAGLLPFGENDRTRSNLSFGKRSHIVDHAAHGGPSGLLTGITVRWTMGRRVAEQLVDLAEQHLGRPRSPCMSANTQVDGAEIRDLGDACAELREHARQQLAPAAAERLVRNYGTIWPRVLALDAGALEVLPDGQSLACEVRHAIREEMAVTLRDVVLRRTDIGAAGLPNAATLTRCAQICADELAWSPARVAAEIELVRNSFPFASPDSQRYTPQHQR